MSYKQWFRFSFAMLALVAIATVASADSVGVSYAGDNGGGTSVQIGAAQTAGVVAQANWNAADGGGGNLAAGTVVDDSGAATTVDVTWSSPNTWGGSGATTDDEAMVNGWLDDGGGTGSTTTVTGIPYDLYDVYVYGSSDAGNEGRGWAVSVNGTQYGSNGGAWETLSANGSFFDGSNYVDGASGANDPTYVKVSGLSGDLTILGVRADVGGLDSRGAVSGFQIVAIPEPASGLLIGLGAFLVGAIARRRR